MLTMSFDNSIDVTESRGGSVATEILYRNHYRASQPPSSSPLPRGRLVRCPIECDAASVNPDFPV